MAPKIHNPSSTSNFSEIKRLLRHFPIPKDSSGKRVHFDYGTAGFRYHHTLLPPIMARIAIFAAIRSSALDGEPVGIMITASHNPEKDNGIKLSDSNGGMLPIKWENMANRFANSDDIKDAYAEGKKSMVVHIGRDTRSHSAPLSQLAVRVATALGAKVIDHGCVTTPQLHHFVLRSNPHNMANALLCGSSGTSFEEEYLQSVVGSYVTLLSTNFSKEAKKGRRNLLVDCACGVGGLKIPMLNKMLQQFEDEGGILLQDSVVQLFPINLPGDGPLNDRCGAEYVQKQQKLPTVYTDCDEKNMQMNYVTSFDGDADRIVFHYKDSNGKLVLLDGDKIAVLVSSFLQEEILALSTAIPSAKEIRCGIVQTAYANGASTNFLKNIVKTAVVIAKTGVKHVHSAAHDNFDVGTYFEANGHGTVLFGPKFYSLLAEAEQVLVATSRKSRATIAWQRLRVLPRLINQAVGDAISDLFLVDAILHLKGWNLQTWNGLYTDMPSRQCKVQVKDRSMIQTNGNETKSTAPSNLQPALEAAMRSLANPALSGEPRAFVRPSGTEDAVRVYAEATTQVDANILASEAAALVYNMCDGVGELPSFVNGGKL